MLGLCERINILIYSFDIQVQAKVESSLPLSSYIELRIFKVMEQKSLSISNFDRNMSIPGERRPSRL